MPDTPLITVRSLSKRFPIRKGLFIPRVVGQNVAVDAVNLEIYPGETLGLVGQSGSGKTVLGRLLLGLMQPTAGTILFEGKDLARLSETEMRRLRRYLQIVFQNPTASLNPRRTVGESIAYPMRMFSMYGRQEERRRVMDLLELVGLNPEHVNRYPHEFSGGQKQRIVIARALAANPKFIVLDEPVSALDVSIQAQILNLIRRLQSQFQLTYLFIGNNLNVVYYMSDRVAVMAGGRLAEVGPAEDVFRRPRAEATQALLTASLDMRTMSETLAE